MIGIKLLTRIRLELMTLKLLRHLLIHALNHCERLNHVVVIHLVKRSFSVAD